MRYGTWSLMLSQLLMLGFDRFAKSCGVWLVDLLILTYCICCSFGLPPIFTYFYNEIVNGISKKICLAIKNFVEPIMVNSSSLLLGWIFESTISKFFNAGIDVSCCNQVLSVCWADTRIFLGPDMFFISFLNDLPVFST